MPSICVICVICGKNRIYPVTLELYRVTNLCLRGELDPDSAVDRFVAFRQRWIVAN